jgi:hypothetical protein
MTWYRLVIQEIKDAEVIANHTRWVDSVQVKGADHQVHVTFSPRFEHIWLESKKRLPDYVAQKPANMRLRSHYALRLYSWAKKYVLVGTKRISPEISSRKRLCRSGRTCARERWIPRSRRSIKDGVKYCTRVIGAISASEGRCVVFAIKAQATPNG